MRSRLLVCLSFVLDDYNNHNIRIQTLRYVRAIIERARWEKFWLQQQLSGYHWGVKLLSLWAALCGAAL